MRKSRTGRGWLPVLEKNICLLLGPLHLLLCSSCSLQIFVRSSYLHDLPPLHSQASDLLVFSFTNKRKGETSIKFLLPFTLKHSFCSSSQPSCNFRALPCVLGNLREANRSLVWGSSPGNQPQTLMLNGKLVPPVNSRHTCLIPGKFGNRELLSAIFGLLPRLTIFVLAERSGLRNLLC